MLTNFQGALTGSPVLLIFFPLVFLPIFGSISALVILGIKLYGRLQAAFVAEKPREALSWEVGRSSLSTPLGHLSTKLNKGFYYLLYSEFV